jgi:DNA-binding response OmpR family regulator
MAGIIMITASESSSDRAEGYRSGVDLHLIKPLDFDEIQSAVAAIARRLRGRPSTERGLAAAELTLDVVGLQLSGPNQSVTVSSAEMLLLSAMARAAGQRLENWQIIELLGEDPSVYSKAALEVRVVRLRKKKTSMMNINTKAWLHVLIWLHGRLSTSGRVAHREDAHASLPSVSSITHASQRNTLPTAICYFFVRSLT